MSSKDSKKEEKRIQVLTPAFRVSFPNVFKPKSNFEGQEPAYSIQMLFPPGTDLTEMKKAANRAAKKKWGDKENWPKFKHPVFKDGNEKNLENYKDMTVVEARTKIKPGLVDKETNEIIDQSEFYAGCWARATLTCYAYEKMGNKGISFGLQNIQKLRDDEAFSGKRNAKDDFDPIDMDEEGDDFEDVEDDEDDF